MAGIFRGEHDVRIVNPSSVGANFDYLTWIHKVI
jgi:hypothetical protein